MSTQFIRRGLLFFVVAGALGSCLEPPDFSKTPNIHSPTVRKESVFDDFSQSYKDSVIVTVNFEDGDGDLGVYPEERKDTVKTYRDWGNYELKTFQFVNGTYKELVLPVNKRLFFPPLFKNGKEGKGPLEGRLDFSQSFFRDRTSKMVPVRFQIKIRDRGYGQTTLNESKPIVTDTISVPLSF